MNKKTIATILVLVALIACALLIVFVQRPDAERETRLTEEMRAELGAAVLVEHDVSLYLANKNAFDRMMGIWESTAMQRLFWLPTVQQGLALAQVHPAYREFMQTMTQHPLFGAGMPVLKDGLSNEIFVAADDHLVSFLQGIRKVNSAQQFAGMNELFAGSVEEGKLQRSQQEALFENLRRQKDNLRFPNFLIGMKVSEVEDADQFILKVLDSLSQDVRARGHWETIGEDEFYVVTLTGDMLPEGMMRELTDDIDDPKNVEMLKEFLRERTFKVAAGIKNEYLLLSIGRNLAGVESFGAAERDSLAASAAFEPLRKRFKPGLTGVSYASKQLMAGSSGAEQADDFTEAVSRAVQAVPAGKRPDGVEERVERDMAELRKDLKAYTFEPSPFLQFSFANEGIETFTLNRAWSVDSEQLSILRFRGRHPVAFRASKGAETADVYSLAEKWLARGYGYVEDWVVPQMPAEDRGQFREMEAVFLPFLEEVSRINRTQLIPALDGTQCLSVMDTDGEVKNTEFQANSSNALPIPRFGVVVELNDAELFREAMKGYYGAARELLARMRENELMRDAAASFSLPAVQVTEEGLYYYALPWELGEDVFPCAGFAEDMLFLCTSKAMNSELRSPVPPPVNEVVDLGQPAAAVAVMDLEAWWDYGLDLNDAIIAEAAMRDDVPPKYRQAMGLGRFHLDTLYESLGAFRGYAKVATVDDKERVVTHSWLNVRDVE